MFGHRFSWLRTSVLTLAGLLLAAGVTWAHGGGGGHGGGGHGGGHGGGVGHGGGFGHAYAGGMHHGGIGYGVPGRHTGINYGLGLGLGYASGLGLAYGRYGIGYGYGNYGLGYFPGLGVPYGRFGIGYGYGNYGLYGGYPYYGYGYGGGYPYYGGGAYPYYGYASSYGAYPFANSYNYSNSAVNVTSGYYAPTAQAQAPPKDSKAHLLVIVPADAELWFNGTKTKQTGTQREFVSPELTAGKRYSYELKARWMKDGEPVEQTRTVHVNPDSWQRIDLTKPQPAENDAKK